MVRLQRQVLKRNLRQCQAEIGQITQLEEYILANKARIPDGKIFSSP